MVVVDGGVAGCSAAISAARRGHRVTLLVREGELGGQWIAASIPLAKGDFGGFVGWQRRMPSQLGVDVRLGVSAPKRQTSLSRG